MRQAILLLFITMVIAIPVYSQNGIVTSIRVEGLTRTSSRVVKAPLQRFIGQEASSISEEQITALILDLGILELLSVEFAAVDDSSQLTLVVTVRERWTLFPAPVFFMTRSAGITTGILLFDSNAFGLNHNIAAGWLFHEEGWVIAALYAVPARTPGTFGWNARFFYYEGDRRHTDENDNTLRSFNLDSLTTGFSLQYQITNALNARIYIGYTHITIHETNDLFFMQEPNVQFFQFGPRLSARRTNWDGYFLSEKSVSAEYEFKLDFTPQLWHSISLRGVYERSLFPGFRLNTRSGVLFRPNAPVFWESGPSEAQVSILPASFSARHYAGLSMGLEKSLIRFSFGTMSLLGAWQMVYSYGPILQNRFDYGITSSIRFYMNRLAIPAVGMGVAYNIAANYFQFSFNMGMSF